VLDVTNFNKIILPPATAVSPLAGKAAAKLKRHKTRKNEQIIFDVIESLI
jgi:hypothetical protein